MFSLIVTAFCWLLFDGLDFARLEASLFPLRTAIELFGLAVTFARSLLYCSNFAQVVLISARVVSGMFENFDVLCDLVVMSKR